jgi:predicted metalloendopeptidase
LLVTSCRYQSSGDAGQQFAGVGRDEKPREGGLRVTGPITNIVPFYDAFGVKPGDKMYRGDDVRVKIW